MFLRVRQLASIVHAALQLTLSRQPVSRAIFSPLPIQRGANVGFVRLLQQDAGPSNTEPHTSTSALEEAAAERVKDPSKSVSSLQRQRAHFSQPLGRRAEVPAVHLPKRFGQNQEVAVADETRKLLEQIVSRFRNVRWAVAYGSGVFGQDGYDPNAVSFVV
jgi:hypothetical protein